MFPANFFPSAFPYFPTDFLPDEFTFVAATLITATVYGPNPSVTIVEGT